ncbi:MAG: efflux RND transporter permease subunit [Oscillospiraceae bacterium]|nr:efflux RND transporter permease subunit [Oscillospiraceae bacterium]
MPKFSVKRPLTVFVAVLAVVVLGVVAYLRMTPDLLPNMDFPYAVVITTAPGESPESVEETITRPMERAMATLEHIKSVTSTSRDSLSLVVLEFENGTNMDTLGVDIQQKITALAGQWDDTVGAPYVLKINPSVLPVEIAAVSYRGMDIHSLSEFVNDTLAQKLEGITGVASVSVSGTLETQAHVVLDQAKMDRLSQTLYGAMEAKLEETRLQLQQTREQIRQAQDEMKTAQRDAVGGAVETAIGAVRDGLAAMDEQRAELAERLARLEPAVQEWREMETELLTVQSEIAALEQLGGLPAETLNTLKSREAELTALRDEKIASLRALGAEPEQAEQALEELRDTVSDVEDAIRALGGEEASARLTRQITDGALTGLDALTGLTVGTVQINEALSKIDEALGELESYRETASARTDLSAMLSVTSVSALLAAQNFSMPAGYVQDDDGVSYMVSVGDRFSTREQLEDLLLFDFGSEDVPPVYLRDVATVAVLDNADRVYTKINGEDGVSVTFTKQSNYATAAVSKQIAARFEKLEAEYEGLRFQTLMDQGEYIYLIVNAILSSLLWGAVFAVVVLFLFLRDWRPTVITLLSIPVSVVLAVVLMYFSGVTINMISLSGLAVSVGMLVDNSVVVIENTYRLRAKGATVIQAAVSGAGQVLGAIVASTLTTVAVFLPIVFVEGITKQLFTDLALTMTFSLLASLLTALTLVPAMASGLLGAVPPRRQFLLERIYPAYRRALTWSLDHKAVILGGAAALLVLSGAAAISRGFSFMPEIDVNNTSVTVTMPEEYDLSKTRETADEVMRRAMTMDNVETVGAVLGGGNSLGGMRSLGGGSGGNTVSFYITVAEGASGMEAGRTLETLCADLPCTVEASAVMSFDTLITSGVTVQLFGDSMEDLQSAARTLAGRMETVEGVASVSDGLEDAVPALQVTVDPTAAMQKGMTVAQIYLQVASALSTSADGADLTLDGVAMGLLVENDPSARLTRETLLELEISPSGSSVSSLTGTGGLGDMANLAGAAASESGGESFLLGEVATVEERVSLQTIQRDQQRRYIAVTAEVAEGYNITRVTGALRRAAAELELPSSVSVVFDGENEAIMEAVWQLVLMLGLGVLLVYLIMAAQFQSLKSPLIVMFTIPLAFTGGFLSLLIAGIEISVISLIGFVMLVGIIVNNGIVLVDYINQQRISGMERRAAIIDAGVTRMRPILMTSLTTILGLAVMALARSAGTALMQPVALVCIGGLLYATLMTLFVVPCIYELMNKKELRHVAEDELKTIDL